MENLMYGWVTTDIAEFVVEMDTAGDINVGFDVLAKYVERLGFDAISYSAIPRSLGIAERFSPVFLASSGFSGAFLRHYDEAALWEDDFTIERITSGSMTILDWKRELKTGTLNNGQENLIKLASEDYGIKNAITIPTQSDQHVIAGGSITSGESGILFTKLSKQQLNQVGFLVRHFHSFVFSKVPNRVPFYKPVIDDLSPAEKRVLSMVIDGRPLKQCMEHTGVSPTRAGNILSGLYRRLKVSNVSELAYLIGYHQVLDMFEK